MSIREMKRPPQNYQQGNPLSNKYHDAEKVWDERIGSSRVQAANWRIMALGLLTLCIVLTLGLIYQGSQSKIRPYMVRIENDGSAQNAGPIPSAYIPQLPEIKYFLSQFVVNTQGLPLDPIVAKQNWVNAYSFLRPAAAQKLNKLVQQQNPFQLIGKETREVEISVVAPISQNTYQVRWRLSRFDDGGNQISESNYTGMFTIDLSMPKDEKLLKVNPLGLFVRDFTITKEN